MSKVEGSPSPPALPTLFCLKSTGPAGSSSFTATAMTRNSQERHTSTHVLKATSKARLKAR